LATPVNDLAAPQIGVPLLVVVFGSGQTHPETGNLGGHSACQDWLQGCSGR
jgi:hypothetical protein